MKYVLATLTVAAYALLVGVGYWQIAIDLYGDGWVSNVVKFLDSGAGSTLVAGFGGAALGGILSYVLAKGASAETLRRDAMQREELEHVTAMRVLVSTAQLTNHAFSVHEMIQDARNKVGPDGELWLAMTQIVGGPPLFPHFEAADFLPFIRSRDSDLIDACWVLERNVLTIDGSLNRYNELRGQWDDFSVEHGIVTPGPGSSFAVNIAADHLQRATILSHLLRNLSLQLETLAQSVSAEGLVLSQRISGVMQKRFKGRPGIKIVTAPPAP